MSDIHAPRRQTVEADFVPTLNDQGAPTSRLSDEALHREAWNCFRNVGWELGSAQQLIRRIIKYKVWKARGFKSFAEYALHQTSEGLNINNDSKLWMLRQSLDATGEHINEWTDICEKIDGMVKLQLIDEGATVKGAGSKSLRVLAGGVVNNAHRITYLPSRNNRDAMLLRLRNKRPELFKLVATGKIKRKDAFKEAGVDRRDSVRIATSFVNKMTKKDLRRFIDWLREEGHI